jgi:hypothetical protein
MGRRCAHAPARLDRRQLKCLAAAEIHWPAVVFTITAAFGLPLLRGGAEVIRVDCDLVSLRVDMAFSAGTDDVSTDRCRGEAVSLDAQLGP